MLKIVQSKCEQPTLDTVFGFFINPVLETISKRQFIF